MSISLYLSPQFKCMIFHIIVYILLHLWVHVYYEVIWPAPSCLDGSVGRALHPYCKGHEFKSHWFLMFCMDALIHCTLNVPKFWSNPSIIMAARKRNIAKSAIFFCFTGQKMTRLWCEINCEAKRWIAPGPPKCGTGPASALVEYLLDDVLLMPSCKNHIKTPGLCYFKTVSASDKFLKRAARSQRTSGIVHSARLLSPNGKVPLICYCSSGIWYMLCSCIAPPYLIKAGQFSLQKKRADKKYWQIINKYSNSMWALFYFPCDSHFL